MTIRTRSFTNVWFVVFGLLAFTLATVRFLTAAAQNNTVTLLSSASYEAVVAPDSVATAFGTQLATATAVGTDADPNTPGVQLPTTLGGTSVEINGRRAELFFVSPTQINLLIPAETPAGVANARVIAGGNTISTGTITVSNVAPAIFTANADGRGVPSGVLLRVKQNGAQSYEALFSLDARTQRFVSLPIDLGPQGEQVYLIMFGTGVRRASDANGDGNVNETVRVVLAGAETTPQFIGRTDLAGVDQANVLIPRSLIGRGKVTLSINAPGANSSNVCEIEIAGGVSIMPPQVNGFGTGAALAGQTITIQGNGFSTTPGDNLVRIGDLEAPVTVATATQLTALVPFGAESAPVTVRTTTGETRSANPLNLRTSVSGVVETTARQPLSDVQVQLTSLVNGQTVTARTGANGVFVAADVPVGGAFMRVVGSGLTSTPALETVTLAVIVAAGRDNQYAQTIFLQPVSGASAQVSNTGALANNNARLSLSIPSFKSLYDLNSAVVQAPTRLQTGNVTFELAGDATVRFPGGAPGGRITLTQVEGSHVPVRFPAGIFSSVVVQLTPFGATFNPGGKLIFPNPDGYAAGAQLKLFKLEQSELNTNLGRFVEVGTATVSGNGQQIETGANAITEAAYYFVAAPRPTTTVIGRTLDADRTPVRRALIRVRGQEDFSDGNGGFIIRNVPVLPGNDTLTVEASLLRATGRVERLQRTGIPAVKDGTTQVAPELVFGAANANQLPFILAPDNLTALASQTTEVMIFASDPDGAQPVNLAVNGASFASIIPNISVPNNFLLRLRPAVTDAGARDLTLVATDNRGGSATRTIRLTVTIANRAPVANTQSTVTDEDTPKQITLSGADEDNDGLTFTLVTQPTKGTLSGTPPNLMYTPNKGFAGTDSFTFKVNDGKLDSPPATVHILVNRVNHAPVLDLPGPQNVAEGQNLSFKVTATDPDTGQIVQLSAPARPTGASFIESSGVFTWTPNFDQAGTHTVMFVATDNGRPPKTDIKTVTITVAHTNRAPNATAQTIALDEDKAANIKLAGSDLDGDDVMLALVTPPQRGTLNGTAPYLTYTPNKDYNGTDSFTFKANDGKLDSAPSVVTINIAPVNDPPAISLHDMPNIKEGQQFNLQLTATDVDAGQSFTFTSDTLPNGATLTPAGAFAWKPGNKQAGNYMIVLSVTDNGTPSLKSSTGMTINVTNPAPVATAQNVTLNEDTSKAIALPVTDPDGDALGYTIVNQPAHGTLSGTGPNLTYTPAPNYNGTDSFTFKANDGVDDSNAATVSLAINAVNDAPVLNMPSPQTVNENQPLTFTVSATDADTGQTLSFAAGNLPNGAAFNAATRTFSWTPGFDQAGTYTINFTATDNGAPPLSDTEPVKLTVNQVNRAPVANAQQVTTNEDTAKQITLAGNDADGSTLSFVIVAQPAKGTLSGTAPNLTYTPAANYNGADSFSFKINDGTADSAAATVSITINPVNDAPVLTVPGAQTVNENQPLSFTLTATDVDAGQTRTFSATGLPNGATFNAATGAFSWTPSLAQAGSYNVTFTVTDNGTPPLSDTETVRITVNNVNTAPQVDSKQVMTNEDTAVQITLTGSDSDGDQLSFAIVAQPQNGKLSGFAPTQTYTPNVNFNGTDTFTYKANDGKLDSGVATVTITVKPVNDAPVAANQSLQVTEDTPRQITLSATDTDNNTLTFTVVTQPTKGKLSGTAPNLTYTPNANATGADSFTFKANDGTADSNIAPINLTIGGVNDAPVANGQTLSTNEDTPLSFKLTASDPDGDLVEFTIISYPTKGKLSGNPVNFLYTPDSNVNGTDSLTFKVSDGKVESALATVNITINQVNDAPALIVPVAQTVDEGALLEFSVSANDVDTGQTLSFSAANMPSGATFNPQTRIFQWSPAFDKAGNYSVSFTVTDNGTPQLSDTKTVALTVKNFLRAPIATAQQVTANEDTSKQITLAGSDPEKLPLTFTIITQPAKGTLQGSAPNLTYVPAANYSGADSFTFKVRNGLLDSNTATVSLTVNPVNDAPTITMPAGRTVNTGEAINFTVAANDIDTGQKLTFSSTALPTGATFNTTTGAFAWTPTANQAGNHSITFTVTDNGTPPLNASKTMNFTINSVNRAPTATAQQVTTNEDTAKQITLAGNDPDNNPLTFAIVAQPQHGTLNGTPPNVTYTPAQNYNGPDSFTFKVNDGKVDSANAQVTIAVNAVNDAPVLTVPGTQNANTGQAVNFTVTATDVDTGQTLTFTASGLPQGATFNAQTRAFNWTPTSAGNFTINFTATDNGTPPLSNTKPVQISVSQSNQPPTCTAQNVSTNEDTPKQITLACTDPNSNPLTYSIVAQPAHGAVTLNGTTATYTPAANYNGPDSFTFKANDGSANSQTATITLTVNPVCDAPALTVPGAQTASANNELVFTVSASDPDGGTLTLEAMNLPTGATFTKPSANTGQFRWTPAATFPSGTVTVTFKVTDNCAPTALTDTKTVNITFTQVVQNQNWTQTAGPEGGKITAIASGSNNNIFVATLGGGVFRSTNNGDTWAAANGGLTNRDVTSLIFRNGVLYAGTAGGGVFRSQDNGGTWAAFNTGLSSSFVFHLAVNDTHLFASAATTIFNNHNVFRTALNAANWSAYGNGLTPDFYSDLLIAGTKIFVSTFTEGVFASPTDNADWADFSAGFPLFGSAASKASTRVQALKRDGARRLAVDVRVNSLTASGGNIYAGTDRGVFVSPLNEVGWTSFSAGLNDTASIGSIEAIGSALYARSETLTFESAGFTIIYDVVKTPLSSASWASINNGIANRAVNAFAANGSTIIAGTEGSGVYRSTNGGGAWAASNAGLTATFVNTLFVKGNTIFAGTDGGGVFTSSNNGQSWTPANNGLSGLLPLSINVFALDGSTVYAGTNGRGVYRSTNDGAAWSAFNNDTFGSTPVRDLVVSDNKLFAAAGDLGLFASQLNAATWEQAGNLPALLEVTALFKTQANLFVGTGSGSVYRSDLTGANWGLVGGGLTISAPITSFALRGTTLLVARNGDGVYRSTNNGDTFTQAISGLANQNVSALRSADSRVYAATNGGGVFVTSNDGTSWTQIVSNLSNLRVRAVIVKDGVIYVGTEGSGVFSRSQ